MQDIVSGGRVSRSFTGPSVNHQFVIRQALLRPKELSALRFAELQTQFLGLKYKSEVNDLLERIGSDKLTTKYNGTFTITGSFNIEVEDEDEIQSIIEDNTDVSNYSADIDVDQIEVHDVEEDN
jgi:hypothetical protein